tara:strand:- start:227 stop:418 length:192 start_codon:yes stop_codon:yes gene_type:complete
VDVFYSIIIFTEDNLIRVEVLDLVSQTVAYNKVVVASKASLEEYKSTDLITSDKVHYYRMLNM